ncbi:putative transcriptional regulatory protein [Colletotrichum gloeosporioides]|uniref:Putative transcriptional regulatory protein n=1 Tax=Colletotrichum gloeosporioides TaxID=474922 RepID=A0A8H4CQH1_COLGL|nr:putative transcriptional regulatory protein [Colletotrichum gloeosporioides]KAF3808194.1 putative transcriptional regulatory protein [Colletotrichum gloeosporioides]
MPPDRHASRASFACTRCKKDKRRCDISQVLSEGGRSCTLCRNKNEKCEVRYGEDKRSHRRPSESKALHQRMQALEEFVRNASRVDGQSFSIFKDDDSSRSLRQFSFPSPASSSSPGTHTRTVSMPSYEKPETWITTPRAEPTPNSLRSESVSSDHIPYNEPMLEQLCFPSAMDEAVQEEGAAENDAYLGYTSMFPYLEEDASARGSKAICPTPLANRRPCVPSEVLPEPEPIVAHLLDLFWQWQAPHLLVIDRDLFVRHRKLWDDSGGQGDRTFYTPTLLYAILSLASMISLDKGVVRYSASSGGLAGDNFATRARELLELELEHPTTTTVQTALILGFRFEAAGHASLGWMYSGMAFRIASDLRLHLDCSKSLRSGRMSSDEARLRQRVFWACHQADADDDITTSVPERQAEKVEVGGYEDCSLCYLHASSTLSILSSKTQTMIYGQRNRRTPSELRSTARRLHEELWRWHRMLPQKFRWSSDESAKPSSEVLLLHMTFYFNLIMLHRPFMNHSRVATDLDVQASASFNSTTVCCEAATKITKLAFAYRNLYNVKQMPPSAIHFIFIAGTIHLMTSRLSGKAPHEHLLQSCMEMLPELSNSYPTSEKAHRILRDMSENWKNSNKSQEGVQAVHVSQTFHDVLGETTDQGSDFEVAGTIASKAGAAKSSMAKSQGCLIASSPTDILHDVNLYDEITLGQGSSNCGFLGSGMEWLSDNDLFESIGGADGSFSYA